MNKKIHVLIIFGGGGNEHDISILSKGFYKKSLSENSNFQIIEVEIDKTKKWMLQREQPLVEPVEIYLNSNKQLCDKKTNQPLIEHIDYIIPCLHGAPGETGQLQGLLDIYNIPYFGNGLEVNAMAMNKITTKLWLQNLNIAIVDFITLTKRDDPQELKRSEEFFKRYGHVFVKASSEGSSVGIYSVKSMLDLHTSIDKAFEFSPYVLLERAIKGREIEVSTYHYGEEIIATRPGEIYCTEEFYDYNQKYSQNSKATTTPVAKDISQEITKKIQDTCIKIFKCMKFKDLARIDFFLENDGTFYVNEINTFPGSTPISLFPQMMIHHGHTFAEYLNLAIKRDLGKRGSFHS